MNIAIWGCGNLGKELCKTIDENCLNDKVVCFVDNDLNKVASNWNGIEIISKYKCVDYIEKKKIDMIFLPTYHFSEEIKAHAIADGISKELFFSMDINCFKEKISTTKEICQIVVDNKKVHHISNLDYEVAEHCNLNCKGCNHFCNISQKESLGDFDLYSRDLKRISELVDSIGTIKLLGGEPLLNAELFKFIYEAKRVFPYSRVHIVTNGMPLRRLSLPPQLVQAIHDCDVCVEISLYPINQDKIDSIIRYLKQNNIRYAIYHVANEFAGQIRIEGDSDQEKSHLHCSSRYCHMFSNGKLGKCDMGLKIDVFNRQYNLNLPKPIIDIFDDNISPADIESFLENSVELCKYCGQRRFYKWEPSNGKVGIEQYLSDKPWK